MSDQSSNNSWRSATQFFLAQIEHESLRKMKSLQTKHHNTNQKHKTTHENLLISESDLSNLPVTKTYA